MKVRSSTATPFKTAGTGNAQGVSSVQAPASLGQAGDALQAPSRQDGWDLERLKAAQQQSFRFLSYIPELDSRYHAKEGLAALWHKARLWTLRQLPFLNPEFANEQQWLEAQHGADAVSASVLKTNQSNTLQKATSLLQQTNRYLSQQDSLLSDDSWLKLSMDLNALIEQDLQERLQGLANASAEKKGALLDGLLLLLHSSQAPELKAFAVTAYHESQGLKYLLGEAQEGNAALLDALVQPGTQAAQALWLVTLKSLSLLLGQMVQVNAHCQTLRNQLDKALQSNPGSLDRGLPLFSNQVPMQLRLILNQADLELLYELQPRLFATAGYGTATSPWQTTTIIPSESGELERYGLSGVSVFFRSEEAFNATYHTLMDCQKENQQSIQALMALLLRLLLHSPALQSAYADWCLGWLLERPSPSLWMPFISLIGLLPEGKSKIKPCMDWLEKPGLMDITQLPLAAKLSQLFSVDPSAQMQLQQALLPFGITQRPILSYDAFHWKGLKRRLENTIVNNDGFYVSLVRQFRLWQSAPDRVPLLTLAGPSQSGKSWMIGQLVKGLNCSTQQTECTTQPEMALAPQSLWSEWNSFVLDCRTLSKHAELVAFKFRIHEWLVRASYEARLHPGRPCLLVFDHMEVFAQPPFTEYCSSHSQSAFSSAEASPNKPLYLEPHTHSDDVQEENVNPVLKRVPHLNYFYERLRELKSYKRYTSPFTGEVFDFSQLMLIFSATTSESASAENGYAFTNIWDHPLLQMDKRDPASLHLFENDNVVHTACMDRQGTEQWLRWLFEGYGRQLVALKLHALSIDEAIYPEMVTLLERNGITGQDAMDLLIKGLFLPLYQLDWATEVSTVTLRLKQPFNQLPFDLLPNEQVEQLIEFQYLPLESA